MVVNQLHKNTKKLNTLFIFFFQIFDKIDYDETKLGLSGSPTKVFQSFPKAMKAPGEVHEVSEEEAVELIVNKLKEKHII